MGHSQPDFIGRLDQIQFFEDLLLYEGDERWVLNIYGGGGIGKTALLHYYRRLCNQHGAPHAPLIDFYELAYHSPRRVMRDIALGLSGQRLDYFAPFLEATESEPGVHLVGVGEKYLKEAARLFKAGLSQLSQDTLATYKIKTVLFFDTCEQAPLSLRNWLVEEFLCDMPNVVAVVAGRERLTAPPERENEFHLCGLEAFTLEESKNFFASSRLPFRLDERQMADLWSLARGVPILLALAADWLVHDVRPEELSQISSDQFAKSLVQRFADLGELSNAAILYMGHLYHRFNEDIFCKVHPGLDMLTAHKTLGDLQGFQFVKCRPSGNYQLHDHARQLVCDYLLHDDAGLALRLRLSRDVLTQYYRRMQSIRANIQDDPVLQAEQLYHELFIDIHYDQYNRLFPDDLRDALQGYRLFIQAFDAALSRNDKIEICHLLLSVTENEDFEGKFADLPGTAIKRARLWLRDPSQRKEAIALLAKIADEPTVSSVHRIEALLSLSRFAWPEEGQVYQERARQEIQNFMETRPERRSRGLHMLAYLEGILGLACRRQGRWGEALEHYQRALEVLEQAPNSDEKRRQMAAARNNLSFIYRQRGDLYKAEILCRLSLATREEMQEIGQIAYSYHTLGEIYLDIGLNVKARHYLLKSLAAFREVGDMRNAGMVFVDLAILARQRGTPDLADYYYNQALSLFTTWEVPEGIVDANNERACELHRRGMEQVGVGDIESALENYQLAEALLYSSLERLRGTDKYYRLAYTQSRLCLILKAKVDIITDAWEKERLLDEMLALADQVEAYANSYNYSLFASESETIRGQVVFEQAAGLRRQGQVKQAVQSTEVAFKHFARACVMLAGSYRSPSQKFRYAFEHVIDCLLHPDLSPEEVDIACSTVIHLFEREGRDRVAADFIEDCWRIRRSRGVGSERERVT